LGTPPPWLNGKCLKVNFDQSAGDAYVTNWFGGSIATNYCSVWCFVATHAAGDTESLILCSLEDSSDNIAAGWSLNHVDGVFKFRSVYYEDGSQLNNAIAVATRKWYRLDTKYICDTASVTNVEFRIIGYCSSNDTLQMEYKDTPTLGNGDGSCYIPHHINLGAEDIDMSSDVVMYYDNFKWSREGHSNLLGIASPTRLFFNAATADSTGNWTASTGGFVKDIEKGSGNNTYVYTKEAADAILYDYEDNDVVIGDYNVLGVRQWLRGERVGLLASDHRHLRFGFQIPVNGTNYFIGEGDDAVQKYYFALTDSDESYYGDWRNNPGTHSVWASANFDDLRVGIQGAPSDTAYGSGGKVTETWLEVIVSPNTGDAYLTHAPRFGGVTASSIKVWTRLSATQHLKIAYATPLYLASLTDTTNPSSPKSGVTVRTVGTPVAASDYTIIYNATSLDKDTKYYFNFFVNGESVYHFEGGDDQAFSFWDTLPNCKTFPDEEYFSSENVLAGGDKHEHCYDYQIYQNAVGLASICMFVDLGDECMIDCDILDRLATVPSGGSTSRGLRGARDNYRGRRGYQLPNRHFGTSVEKTMPVERIWSDHDFNYDNSSKSGYSNKNLIYDGGIPKWWHWQGHDNGPQIDLKLSDSDWSDNSTITIAGGARLTSLYGGTGFGVRISNSASGNDGMYTGNIATQTTTGGGNTIIELDQTINATEWHVTTGSHLGDPVGVKLDFYMFRTWNTTKAFKEYSPTYDYVFVDCEGRATGGGATSLLCTNSPERQFNYPSISGGIPVVGDSVTWNAGADTGNIGYVNTDDNIIVVVLASSSSVLASKDEITDGTYTIATPLGTIYNFPTESVYGVYPGMVVTHYSDAAYTSNPSWGVVDSNTGTKLVLASPLNINSEVFANNDYFLITRDPLARTFKIGKTQWWIICMRRKSDSMMFETSGLAGADWLDGTREGVSCKVKGTADSNVASKLVDTSENFVTTHNVVLGDVVYNMDMFRFSTVASDDPKATHRNLGQLSVGDSVTWGDTSGSIIEVATHIRGGPELCILRTSGTGDPVEGSKVVLDGSNYAYIGGGIRNESAVVKSFEQTSNPNDTIVLVDSWEDTQLSAPTYKDLFPNGNSDYEIYESGGSDHGNKLDNEKAGHVQREWLIDGMNNSTAEWKFIICETPVYGVQEDLQPNQYNLLPTIDPKDCLRQYLIENIDYNNVFWFGADQHFSGLDDGKSSNPPFVCANFSPLFGKYQSGIYHVPSISEWYVTNEGQRSYAGWGKCYGDTAYPYSGGKVWNEGAIGLIELINRKEIRVSLYGSDGELINNDVTVYATPAFASINATPDRIRLAGESWAEASWVGYSFEFPAETKTYVVTDSGSDWLEASGANFLSYTGSLEIHARPYVGEATTTYLGSLTMLLSESTYYIVNETFNTSGGTGYDEKWKEVSN
jgi:phosphodiesterase/alkaline phosphatase D-like protein